MVYKKSATWSPAYINETKTPTIFVAKQVPMSPRENSLSGGVGVLGLTDLRAINKKTFGRRRPEVDRPQWEVGRKAAPRANFLVVCCGGVAWHQWARAWALPHTSPRPRTAAPDVPRRPDPSTGPSARAADWALQAAPPRVGERERAADGEQRAERARAERESHGARRGEQVLPPELDADAEPHAEAACDAAPRHPIALEQGGGGKRTTTRFYSS